jgi:choline-sulfatase
MGKSAPMNLLLLLSDEHNRKILGCNGNDVVRTPAIDGIAAGGANFPVAYTNCPICLPSRASFTIGDYPSRHGYWDNAFPYNGEARGFGHRLVDEGFPVVTVGKLHFKGTDPATGFPDQRIPLNAKDGIGDVYSATRSFEQYRPQLGQHVKNARWGESDYQRYDRGVSDEAVRFLKEEGPSHERPWLLKVGFVLPHFPLVAPERFRDMYPLEKMPFPKRYHLDERPDHPILNEMRRYIGAEGEFTEEEVRRAVAVYYGLCSELDGNISRVLDALKETGQDKNTRVIYISDHGDMVGAQGLWWKHCFYEESVGVPFMISGPDIPAGRSITEPVSLLDLYPTILDCFGIEQTPEEQELPGRSLLPAACDEEKLPYDRPMYSEYFAAGSVTGMFMLRKGDFKLCYYAYYPNQLFDMKNDPEETRDLAQDPAFAVIVDELESELRKIVDPERLSLQARIAQLDKIDEHGGFRNVLKQGELFPYSPVPSEFH